MDNIVELDAMRPHITLSGQSGNVHVLPVALIENIISGKVSLAECDPELIRDILADWLTEVQDNGSD